MVIILLLYHNQFNEDYIADKQITTGNLNIIYSINNRHFKYSL